MADKGRDKDETTADVLRRDPEPTHLQKTYIVVAEASLNTFKNWYKVLKKLPDGDPRQNALRDPAKSVSKVLNKLAGLNHDLDLVKTPGVIAKLLGALDNLVTGLQEYQSTGDESGAPLYATYEQRIMDNRDALRSTFAAYQETGDSEAYKTALRDLSKTLDSIVSETKLVRERPPTPDTPPAQLSPGGAAAAADVDVSGHSDPEIENIAARRNAYELSASTDRVDPEPRPAPVPTPHTTDKWAMSESESAPARPTAVPGPETPVSDRGDAPTPDARPVEYNLSESRDDGGDPKRLSFPISESGGGGGGGGGGSQFLLSDSGAPEPIGLSDSGVGGDGDLDGEASSPGGVSEPVATSTPPASRPPIDFVDPRTAAAPVETFSARATYIEGLSRNASVTVDAVNRLEVHVGNNSNLPYIHDDVDLAVWFEGDAGIVEASRIESQGDGSWTVSYRLAAQGGYTCHVRLGGRDGGEDVKNTPFDFVAVDDAPFHTLTNAEVEEVEARDEARDEAREAAINIPTRSSTQPGDIAPRLQPEGMADGTMDDAIPANVAISALVNARNTFRTLDYQAGDLMAVVNGVVRQINELLEKQDVLVTEWKRSEMRRCKIGFEVMDILEVCEAAGVDINTSFFEKPEEFVDIVKRIHAEVYSDGGAESEEHKAAVRAALLREARDIQAATMAAEQQIDKILRGELTEPGRVNDPIQVDVPRFHYMDGAHGGAHHGGGGGGGRHREHGGRHHDEYRYSDEGSDDGSSVVPTARRPQDEMIDLYELARSEIRRMKDAAQRASMKHQLMIARVAQLENELHSRDVSAGEVKSRGPMMPGLGTSKGRGAGGSAASNRNLSWEEREERYQKELDRLSMANAKAKEDARKLAQERDDLRKRLRDATKASNSKLRDAQQANTVYVTDMRRKFENEMRAKNAEIQALLDEKRVQIAELKSALKNRHERELEAVSKKNGVRAATLRNELEELRNVLDDQGAFGLPGGPSPGRRSGRRSGGGRNSHGGGGGGGGGSGGGMASLTRPTKASSGKVRAEQSGGGGGSGAGADSDHSPLARRRDGWKN